MGAPLGRIEMCTVFCVFVGGIRWWFLSWKVIYTSSAGVRAYPEKKWFKTDVRNIVILWGFILQIVCIVNLL